MPRPESSEQTFYFLTIFVVFTFERSVGQAEQCHGATTMTEGAFLIEESSTKANMWGGLRCNRAFVILVLLNVIAFQSIVYYQEHKKWEEVRSQLEPVIADLRDMQGLTYSLLKRLEAHGLFVENVRGRGDDNRPVIYVITPTFARPVQKAELTRLAQTFLHVSNVHWILVEDAPQKTALVTRFLETSGLIYTHLSAATPPNYKLGRNDPNWKKPRGVEQRNAALRWLRENLRTSDRGVVYFADDDNTYSIKLFREMEKIQRVGVWPVGLVGGLMVEKPICDNATKQVLSFNAAWKPDRPFPLDMAGFAINLELLLKHKDAWFSYDVQGGYQESEILRQIVTRDQLEPLADCCTKVYVWHTRTEQPQLNVEQMLIKKGKRSNVGIEV
ncbi:Galactosylgalactosylxylosylprotein 3-beta-glucuronosyltransferase I [Camponotus floridanus]|uniref:Galactosylgalactosylxylosylprotein 3-beta-glucuronosyltransferase n=1 Tax=Camponotus floridanus TaxID=104421 RepID=E2ATZ4_CAMFO|nr:galactosylgalactosylxylosylprotein 3-beta-glucuronosyltransferase I [Camponotus floridanus]EFN63091.1 Galactosylgalactosylxylosylprotein 3-beta-glucuronosyltransferase I [Camponotus floridanus]